MKAELHLRGPGLLKLWGQDQKQSGECKAPLGHRLKMGLKWVTWRAGGEQLGIYGGDTGRLSPGQRAWGQRLVGWDAVLMAAWGGDHVFPIL